MPHIPCAASVTAHDFRLHSKHLYANRKELYKELFLSLGKGIVFGIVLGAAASVGIIWVLLHTFLKDILERRMFSAAGLGISLFFAAVTVLILFFNGSALYEADKSDGYFK